MSLNVARNISVNNPVYPRWSLSPSSRQIVTAAVSVVKPRELCLCRYLVHPCYAEAVMAAPVLHSVPSLCPPPCLTGITSSGLLCVASETNRGVQNWTELTALLEGKAKLSPCIVHSLPYDSMWDIGGTDPLILKLGTKWKWLVSFIYRTIQQRRKVVRPDWCAEFFGENFLTLLGM